VRKWLYVEVRYYHKIKVGLCACGIFRS
jgi:hypothetical protein